METDLLSGFDRAEPEPLALGSFWPKRLSQLCAIHSHAALSASLEAWLTCSCASRAYCSYFSFWVMVAPPTLRRCSQPDTLRRRPKRPDLRSRNRPSSPSLR